ncbi:hypothetical protein [Hymenobacter fodinae]
MTPRVPYRWLPTETPEGYCCLFDDAFLLPARSGLTVAELPIFQPEAYPVWEATEAECSAVEAIFQKMQHELISGYAYKHDLLRTYVWELIHLVQKLQPAPARLATHSAAERVATQFADLLAQQFPRQSPQPPLRLRTAADYADQLAVHVNHLNRVLKETTGHTTTTLISQRLLQEASCCCGKRAGASRKLPIAWALPMWRISAHFSSATLPKRRETSAAQPCLKSKAIGLIGEVYPRPVGRTFARYSFTSLVRSKHEQAIWETRKLRWFPAAIKVSAWPLYAGYYGQAAGFT